MSPVYIDFVIWAYYVDPLCSVECLSESTPLLLADLRIVGTEKFRKGPIVRSQHFEARQIFVRSVMLIVLSMNGPLAFKSSDTTPWQTDGRGV